VALISRLFMIHVYDVAKCNCCRLRLIDVVTCFSWLSTMFVCGWLSESAVLVRLMFTSVTVIVSSCSLVSHSCADLTSKPHLSQCVLFSDYLIRVIKSK